MTIIAGCWSIALWSLWSCSGFVFTGICLRWGVEDFTRGQNLDPYEVLYSSSGIQIDAAHKSAGSQGNLSHKTISPLRKAKRQQLLTGKVSSYCLSALHGLLRSGDTPLDHTLSWVCVSVLPQSNGLSLQAARWAVFWFSELLASHTFCQPLLDTPHRWSSI